MVTVRAAFLLSGRGSAVARVAVTVLLVVGVPAAAAEIVTVEEAVGRALARSPAVQAAVFGTSGAAARQRAARAAYTPQFSAKSEFGRSAGFDERVTNGGITSALVGVEATLLDGGLRDAEFAAARARLRSATAIEQQRRAEVAFATRSAYFTALAARTEERAEADVAAAQRAVPLATEQLQLLRARYLGGGNVRLLEVLDALIQHLEARLGVPRAQRAYRLAVATEEQLLGRTVEP